MSWRSDSTQLIAGRWLSSQSAGLGVTVSEIPNTGANGPGYLFNDIAAQNAVSTDEMYGQILTFPAAGTLTANENSSFSFTGAPTGSYSFTYRGYRNGVSYGDFTVSLTIGAAADNSLTANATCNAAMTAQLSTQIALQAAFTCVATATATFGGAALSSKYLQRWNGSSFDEHPLERWNGVQYLRHPLERWDGTKWVRYNG